MTTKILLTGKEKKTPLIFLVVFAETKQDTILFT